MPSRASPRKRISPVACHCVLHPCTISGWASSQSAITSSRLFAARVQSGLSALRTRRRSLASEHRGYRRHLAGGQSRISVRLVLHERPHVVQPSTGRRLLGADLPPLPPLGERRETDTERPRRHARRAARKPPFQLFRHRKVSIQMCFGEISYCVCSVNGSTAQNNGLKIWCYTGVYTGVLIGF